MFLLSVHVPLQACVRDITLCLPCSLLGILGPGQSVGSRMSSDVHKLSSGLERLGPTIPGRKTPPDQLINMLHMLCVHGVFSSFGSGCTVHPPRAVMFHILLSFPMLPLLLCVLPQEHLFCSCSPLPPLTNKLSFPPVRLTSEPLGLKLTYWGSFMAHVEVLHKMPRIEFHPKGFHFHLKSNGVA